MQSIYDLIYEFERDYQQTPVKVVDGYEFDQSATLKRICLYQNAQFLDGSKDEFGEKVFFDITTPAVRNAAKNIDLDTKDIQFRAINGKSNYFRSWLYRRQAKVWMRKHKIARKLNSIPEEVTGVGSVVVKRVKGPQVFEFVDLTNTANDASAKCLKDGGVAERHYYTPGELRRIGGESGWDMDAVEQAISDFLVHKQENFVGEQRLKARERGNAHYICVHEYNGYAEKGHVTGNEDDAEMILGSFIVVLPHDVGSKKKGGRSQDPKLGLTLYKTEISDDEWMYKELHFRKVKKRWLGRGLYEECFPMQETENTRSNWMLLAMRLSQIIVFQTRESTVLQNILTDVANGSILKFAKGQGDVLSRLDTQVKDNASNNLMGNQVNRVMQGLTNAYEVTTGGNLPSGTPFSLGQLMNQNANKLFDFIREDFGLFLEEIFNDWVLPELEKSLSEESILEIVDQEELEYIREHYTTWKVWDSIKGAVMSNHKLTRDKVQIIDKFVRSQIEKLESIFLKIPKSFLSFEKRVECVVTDEHESPAMMQTLSTVLQMVSQNPAILDNPAFERILDMAQLSKIDLMPKAAPAAAAPNPAAVPAPAV